jgi:hypothetical protein
VEKKIQLKIFPRKDAFDPKYVWTFWRRKESFDAAEPRTLDRPAGSLVSS